MNNPFYEHHIFPNGRQQMIFHPRMIRYPTDYSSHWHDRAEFYLVLEGTLGVYVNGVARYYREGEIGIVSPNDIHSLFVAEGDRVVYHCLLTEASLCPHGAHFPERSSNPVVVSLFHQLNDELFREKKYRPEAMNGLAMALTAMLANEADETAPSAAIGTKQLAVRRAIQYINQNFTQPLTLEDIAQATGVSKYYLSHLCREFTARSLFDHLNYVRCINARNMLSSGVCNVEQAAFQSGFNSLPHFSKTYRRIIGHSPSVDIKKEGNTKN